MPTPEFPQRPAPARRPRPGMRRRPQSGMRRRRLSAPAWLLMLMAVLLLAAACSDASGNLGRYYQGQTLHINVISIERLPELRYATIDPNEVVRDWRLAPSAPGTELALVRVKVENHTAISAAFNVDATTVEMRDFTNKRYYPVSVGATQQRDYRGANEAVVRMDLGQCFDAPRTVVDPGTAVRWVNEGETAQLVDFADPAAGPSDAEVPVGGSVSHPFAQPGVFDYQCSTPDGSSYPAQIEVAAPDNQPGVAPRSATFLEGPFTLRLGPHCEADPAAPPSSPALEADPTPPPGDTDSEEKRGCSVEGVLVFEAPIGTEFRDFRWKAGDSITVRF